MSRADRGVVRMAVRTAFAYRANILATVVTLVVHVPPARHVGAAQLLRQRVQRVRPYPLKIFGGTVEWLLTFALPVAFVAYLPVNALLQPTGRDAAAGHCAGTKASGISRDTRAGSARPG